MNSKNDKVAFITGANRGIGFETAKGLGALGISIVIGVRDIAKGQDAIKQLNALGIQAEAIHYDATEVKTLDTTYDYIASHYGKLDILVNNAGILREALVGGNDSSTVSQDVLQETFQTNLFAVVALTQKLLPLIKKSAAGRIVNLSSILASQTLHSMPNSPIDFAKGFAYNASKTALNVYTIHLAHELKDTFIKVNSAHPGWVKTELGGSNAPMEVADSYKTSVYLATLDEKGPSGGFFHETELLPW
ncbi:putative ketoacyl reductase [mine drainage metagenome]|uniref:Putative ketoacyl reductase n=1 Tax=mine drainage metagenome TaxID=410659 RepID=A0A1J5SFH7_9ZZZZ